MNYISILQKIIAQSDLPQDHIKLLQYILYLSITGILIETQELPTTLSGDVAIQENESKIFNTDKSYYTARLKLRAIKEIQPEIIIYGNSWVNQFRAEMFAPLSFYNCSNLSPKLSSAKKFINKAKEINPNLSVAIIMLHPWHFRSDIYDSSTDSHDKSDQISISIAEYANRLSSKDLYTLISSIDTLTLGIRAIPQHRGTRLKDGSVSFGRHHNRSIISHQNRESKIVQNAKHHLLKKGYFLRYDQDLDMRTIESLQYITKDLEKIGVYTVYLIPPLHDTFREIMLSDSSTYRLWHQFISDEIQDELNSIAPTFDFSAFKKFGGTTDMTYDLWHSTEIAAHLMAEYMKSDKRSPEIIQALPKISMDTIMAQYPTPVHTHYD